MNRRTSSMLIATALVAAAGATASSPVEEDTLDIYAITDSPLEPRVMPKAKTVFQSKQKPPHYQNPRSVSHHRMRSKRGG